MNWVKISEVRWSTCFWSCNWVASELNINLHLDSTTPSRVLVVMSADKDDSPVDCITSFHALLFRFRWFSGTPCDHPSDWNHSGCSCSAMPVTELLLISHQRPSWTSSPSALETRPSGRHERRPTRQALLMWPSLPLGVGQYHTASLSRSRGYAEPKSGHPNQWKMDLKWLGQTKFSLFSLRKT